MPITAHKQVRLSWGPDGRLKAKFPFDEEVKDALKAAIVTDRNWSDVKFVDGAWSIAKDHGDIARAVLQEWANKRGWAFLDETMADRETIAAQEAALQDALLQRHAEAVLAVLADIPSRALALVGWHTLKGGIFAVELEIVQFLGSELFNRVRDASLRNWNATIIASFLPKREGKSSVTFAATPTILRVLLDKGIGYATLRTLSRIQRFEDGVTHFEDGDGTLWLGARYELVRLEEWEVSRENWHFTWDGDTLYTVVSAPGIAARMLDLPSHLPFSAGGSVAVALPQASDIIPYFEQFHALDWLKQWSLGRLHEDQVFPSRFLNERRKPSGYHHAADGILNHIRRFNARAYLSLLNLTVDAAVQILQRVQSLKEVAAAAHVAELRTNAAILARPKLNEMTKAELGVVADRHGIILPKGAKKEAIIDLLLAHQSVCEDIIGLETL